MASLAERISCSITTKVINAIVNNALKMGLTVSVCDGEEWEVQHCSDRKKIIDAVGHTEEVLFQFEGKEDRKSVGWASIIFGLGEDCIADYSDSEEIEAIIKPGQDICEGVI